MSKVQAFSVSCDPMFRSLILSFDILPVHVPTFRRLKFKLCRAVLALAIAGCAFDGRAASLERQKIPDELRVGRAQHAFDHLGNIDEQADAATAAGATILYVTGCGGLGYSGLPSTEELNRQREQNAAYLRRARNSGIRLALGYICATSIVKLDTFARHWPEEFRARFRTSPSGWRQQDRNAAPLPSWYGGDYQPACMNNPDWRTYEKFIVRLQLESGCDGIFFDNPTVHPQGCYCEHCMTRFVAFLKKEKALPKIDSVSVNAARQLAVTRTNDFLRFRCTIARDFFAEMRAYARNVKRGALVTANNSLNSAGVLFAQCRSYAYNISEMSKAEDFVVVEDMSSQPRILPGGKTIEYGYMYAQLHAISHGKPVVAVTIAEADYHTPPNLVRLAMAEAAANGASYLSWPTWPEIERPRMAAAIRPQAEFLKSHEALLNDTRRRADVLLFLPFRNWLQSDKCKTTELAAALSRANVQYTVLSEDDMAHLDRFTPVNVLLVGSMADLRDDELRLTKRFVAKGERIIFAEQPDWLHAVKSAISNPSVSIDGPKSVRALVHDQKRRTIVHLLNLNIERLSSFQDRLQPAENLGVSVRLPVKSVRRVRALTADIGATSGELPFENRSEPTASVVEIRLPRLVVATLLVVE
jgi:hypothetical protein